MWPGIIASAAKVLATAFNVEYTRWWGIGLLLIVGILFNFLILMIWLAQGQDWLALFAGLLGRGEGFSWLPQGLPMATFLAALAYSGAGGNLNLAQSLYVKEKGYGMGKFAGRLSTIFSQSDSQDYKLTGEIFSQTPENLDKFKIWWRNINLEHFFVFWLTGAATMMLLSLLAFSTVYGLENTKSSINFVLIEAQTIA